MKHKKLFVLTVFMTTIIALVFVLMDYRTGYRQVDNSLEIEQVESLLSDNQEVVRFESKNPFNFNDILFTN